MFHWNWHTLSSSCNVRNGIIQTKVWFSFQENSLIFNKQPKKFSYIFKQIYLNCVAHFFSVWNNLEPYLPRASFVIILVGERNTNKRADKWRKQLLITTIKVDVTTVPADHHSYSCISYVIRVQMFNLPNYMRHLKMLNAKWELV